MKVISLINHKGGVGKTSTALAIADGLNRTGKDVLFIDLDPQGNATYTLDVIDQCLKCGAIESRALFDPSYVVDVKHLATRQSLAIIPATQYLALAENALEDELHALKINIKALEPSFEYCIIDTPPALNNLMLDALQISDYAIIPAKTDSYSLKGVEQITDTINAVKETNKALQVLGIVFNMYEPRLTLTRLIERNFNNVAKKMNTKVFDTKIRKAQSVAESATVKQSIYEYAPTSKVVKDYENLIIEILDEIDKRDF